MYNIKRYYELFDLDNCSKCGNYFETVRKNVVIVDQTRS